MENVSAIVPHSPRMMGGRNMLSTMNDQRKPSFVTNMWMNIAVSTASTATAPSVLADRYRLIASGCCRLRSWSRVIWGS
jgi:hypothetical protein